MPAIPLITGATGFAGSHLLDHLLEFGSAAAWGNRRGRPIPADGRPVQWSAVDLLDRDHVAAALAELRPSAIYHCAGVPHVSTSWDDPVRALRVNVLGTYNVLEGLKRAGHACPVLVTSSALVYRSSRSALTEEDPIGPTSPYGLSKLAQELIALRTQGIAVYVARPFNHAGPRQSQDFVTSSFAKQIAEIEAGIREPVIGVGNLESRRDITDVRDTVRGYRAILERGRAGRPYNVCSGHGYRVRDLLDAMVSMSRVSVRVVEDPARMRPSDHPVVLGDRSRLAAETGWQPEIPIERTLADLLDYWRAETARPAFPSQ